MTDIFSPSSKQSTGHTSTQSMYLHFMQFSTTTYVISFPLNLGGIVIRPFGPAYADCSSYVGQRGSTTDSYPVFQELIATPGALRKASSGRLSPCVATPISRPTRTRSLSPSPKSGDAFGPPGRFPCGRGYSMKGPRLRAD